MKNKVVFVGLVIVILAGIITAIAFGFNVDFEYKYHTLIGINIGKDFNISDIKSITDEVFSKQNVKIQKSGVYNDNVAIKVDNVTDEQKELLNTKINEKFGLENSVNDVDVNDIPSFKLRDVAKSYITPLIITTILVLIYMAIRFRKIGVTKIISQTLILSIIAELLYVSIIAITRYPVNRLVMPVGVVIYITILTVLTGMYEKQISTEKE